MATETVTEQSAGFYQEPMTQDTGVMMLRLDAELVTKKIRSYLGGIKNIVYEDKDGNIQYKNVEMFEAKANPQGIVGIMSFIEAAVNPQTVQGFFDKEDYHKYVKEFNRSLVQMVVTKRPVWGIKSEDMISICDNVMVLVIPFMSRLIDNKERESYRGIHYRETFGQKAKGTLGKFNPFSKGG